ncbi:hypothetical protein, partial [Pseudomonas aeruginosa]|uniref:hypothetical protein n=1 Tax=Pseudomonas aeruginosa TaxID=287 RepID=UPI00232B5987
YGEMSELSCQCLQCRHSVFPSPGERQLNKPSARSGQTLADFRQKNTRRWRASSSTGANYFFAAKRAVASSQLTTFQNALM